MTVSRNTQREGSGRVRFGGAVLRSDDLVPGTIVAAGAYEIVGVLGRGGMATVYSAIRRADGREVAFKLLDAKAAARADVEVRLANERSLPSVVARHPGVVAALDGGRLAESGGAPYLVTERVHGPELSYLIATERRLPALRAAALALEIADALEALHAHRIAHRDVKPDNVLVVRENDGREHAKLIDFGLVARIAADEARPLPHDQVPDQAPERPSGLAVANAVVERVTLVGERPGTPVYMSPEQSLGAAATGGFDVYSLGVTLYEMLAGVTPFAGVGERDLLDYKVHRHAAMDLTSVRDDLPPTLPWLVGRALEPVAAQRLTLAELQRGLRAILGLRVADPARRVEVTELGPRVGGFDVSDDVRVVTPSIASVELPREAVELPREPAGLPREAVELPGEPACLPREAVELPREAVELSREGVDLPRGPVDRARDRDRRVPVFATIAVVLGLAALGFGVRAWLHSGRDEPGGASAEPSPTMVEPALPEPAPPEPAMAVPAVAVPEVLPTGTQDESTPPPSARAVPEPTGVTSAGREPVKPKRPSPGAAAPSNRDEVFTSAACEASRNRASAGLEGRDWSAVLAATSKRGCWERDVERLRLRVRAFAELERWDACIAAARGSTDEKIRRHLAWCLEKQETP